LVQCALDQLILKILALEPLHGWAIGQRLKQVSGDVLQVSDMSLYAALQSWNRKAGLLRNGNPATTIVAPGSTA
jgi:PadR family transcriptional regulator, regulatory protein PadR